jgi:hypothetical protein
VGQRDPREAGALVIVSHKHRFIFHKMMRTGSTSIEAALAPHLGNDDIVTEAWDGSIMPRNNRGAWNHMPPLMLMGLVGSATWDSYLTVTTVRNPWTRLLSVYRWLRQRDGWTGLLPPYNRYHQGPANATFRSWVTALPLDREEDDYLDRDGEPWCRRVIRFESLKDDFSALLRDLALPPIKLAHKVPSAGEESAYDEETTEKVRAMHPRLIARFSYSLPMVLTESGP